MACVEEKIINGGVVTSGPSTLLEEMKLLKAIQDQSGARKAIHSELWHACAGPLVSLPQVGSLVYYFPQGHSEQVAISTKRTATSQIPNYPNLPSQLMCQVHNVTLHADKETDEIFAQMSLQPVNSEKDIFPIPDFGLKVSKHPSEFFCKTLTASDTSTHGGFSVPRRAAEKLFPPLDYSMQPPTQELVVRDLHDNTWTFRHIYRGQPKRHLLTTGWSLFVSAKRLRAGDAVLFIRDEKSQLMLGVRRANRQQTALPSSVLSADSMHIGVLAAAAHAAANRSPFTIFYNPRACPSEFVIPVVKYRKSVYGTQLTIGMRFGMMFETEESGKRRYMGTIVGISDLDPLRWPSSKWRNLQVEWDEPGCGDKQNRVSLWDIETPESLFIFPSLSSSLKRPYHPGFIGSESEWGSLIKRPFVRIPGNGNMDFPYPPISNLCSEQLIKMLMKPHDSVSMVAPPQAMIKPSPSENMLSQNQNNPPDATKLPSENHVEKLKVETLPSVDQFNQSNPAVKMAEEKLDPNPSPNPNPMNPPLPLQASPWLMQPPYEPSIYFDASQMDCMNSNGVLSYPDNNDEWSLYNSSYQSLPGFGRSSVFGKQDPSMLLQETLNPTLPQMGHEIWDHQPNALRNSSDESHNQSGIYGCLNYDVSNNGGGSTVIDPTVSSTILDDFCTLKEAAFMNPSDCLVGNISSSQDVQSQITTASLADSQAFSREFPDNSGGTSSSNVDFDESSLLQNSSWQQVVPPMRTYTKVQKAGSVGRSIDVTSFKNYDELCSAIECMFGLEGLINDPRGSGWKLVYVDYENDVLLVGDDPWEEFVGCVRCIRILSPSEVQQMSEEGMQLLNSTAVQGINVSASDGGRAWAGPS